MPKGAAYPIQKDDEGEDLDGPKLDVVNDPVRIETSSTHTISYPAERDWRP
jgi:hypothetical protein